MGSERPRSTASMRCCSLVVRTFPEGICALTSALNVPSTPISAGKGAFVAPSTNKYIVAQHEDYLVASNIPASDANSSASLPRIHSGYNSARQWSTALRESTVVGFEALKRVDQTSPASSLAFLPYQPR